MLSNSLCVNHRGKWDTATNDDILTSYHGNDQDSIDEISVYKVEGTKV